MDTDAQPASPARAHLLYFAAIACFCGLDATIKHLGASEHPLTVSLGRYAFALVFAVLIWLRAGKPRLTAEIWRAHAMRGVVIAITSVSFIWSLTILPLADAITFFFVGPLVIPVLAAVLLKERLRGCDALASLVGFGGAVLALSGGEGAAAARHGSGLYMWGVVSIVVSVLTYALSVVLLRARAGRDGSAVIGIMGTLIPGLIVAGPAVAFGAAPAQEALPFYIAMGIFAAAGVWLAAEAFARAEAQQLAPIEFSALPWAALYGYAFFSEVPRPQLWAGAALIIAACMWSGWANARAAKPGTALAAPP
jgi:S-adenosylmethionine uptake transporter